MPSLNLNLDYFDHAKAMRLEARLGPGADVLPIRLWAYVGRHYPTLGCVAMLEAELERVCRWWGEKGVMVSAMLEIGFLESDGDKYTIHDWFDHSGHLSKFKKRAEKAARKRWGIKSKRSNASSIASVKSKQSPSRAVHNRAVQDLKTTKRCDFQKPTLEEVQTHIKANNLKIDGLQFFDHYEANGWRVGRNPMKDWKAACRTWNRRSGEFGGNINAPNGGTSISEQVAKREREAEAKRLREIETPYRKISPGV